LKSQTPSKQYCLYKSILLLTKLSKLSCSELKQHVTA
jgi:hypothetical protein